MTKTVMFDAGHGGKDPGASGFGIREKDIALKIAMGAAKQLQDQYEGVRCLLTRSTDVYLELKERTDMANEYKADVLVSIHCNAGGGAGGFESFTYNGSKDKATAALQDILHSEIMARLKPYNIRDRGQKRANHHMTRESKMPAVLTENLFIDVEADASRLKQTNVIDALIDGHVAGVAKYLGLKPKQAKQSNVVDVYVNSKRIGSGEIENGVTLVPVRAVSEALGAKVGYDAKRNRVDINT